MKLGRVKRRVNWKLFCPMAYSSEIELQESLKASGEGKQRLQREQQLVPQAYIIQQYTFDKSACLPLNLKRHDNEDHNIVQRGDHKLINALIFNSARNVQLKTTWKQQTICTSFSLVFVWAARLLAPRFVSSSLPKLIHLIDRCLSFSEVEIFLCFQERFYSNRSCLWLISSL